MNPRRPVPAVLAVLVLAAGACGGDDGGGERADGSGPTSVVEPTTSTVTTAPVDTTSATTTLPPAPAPLAGMVIVLDPGHNGGNGAHPEIINRPVDAGGFEKACNTTGAATDSGITESAVNWAVAQLLRDRLVAAGAEVVLTRTDDAGVGPCIDERGLVAAEAQANLLISLHADGGPADAHGFHVIHPALRPGYTDATVAPSAELAGALREALVAGGFTPATYVGEAGLDQRDDLGTLNRAGVPAVMVEAGNLRNATDAALLTGPDGQVRLADALTAGTTAYLA